MNLKNCYCGKSKLSAARSANHRPRPRRRPHLHLRRRPHRHRRLPRRRLRPSRSDCPNYPTRNCHHRTSWECSSRLRRCNWCYRLRSCHRMICDWNGGSAAGSSAHSRSAMYRRPQLRMSPWRSSSFPHAGTSSPPRIAHGNTRYPSPLSSPNVATPFIDHSSEMWNFRCNGPLIRCPLLHEKGEAMRKTLMALAAVATLAVSAVAAPQAAEARGGRIAAGIAAGVIGSAIVGGAIASQRDYYGSGYYGRPAYVEDAPCVWQRQRFWDGYGWRVRRVQVCD